MNVHFVCDHEGTRRWLASYMPEMTVSALAPSDHVDLLIRWGANDGEDRAQYVLNCKRAVTGALDVNQVGYLMSLNRIPAALSAPRTATYRVYLFDLRSFAIAWRTSRGWRLIAATRRLVERLVIRSRRALYALGLHGGCVDLAINRRGNAVVVRIQSGPPLPRVLSERLAQALKSFIEQRRYTADGRNVVLGADPEFILSNRATGRLVVADRYFPYRGTIGHDRLFVRQLSGRPLAELRPRPSANPKVLFDHIRSGMRRASRRTGHNIGFTAGSLPFSNYPAGGHIHFSNIALTTKLLQALDTYLAIPLLLIDHPSRSYRRRLRYGFLGDFRFKRHGGFEYRSLPSWLVTPSVSLAVLCLAKTVAQEYDRLPHNVFQRAHMQRAFYRADKEPFHHIVGELWQALESVPTYWDYAEHLQPLKQWIDERHIWPDRTDLKPRWLPRPARRRRRRRRRQSKR